MSWLARASALAIASCPPEANWMTTRVEACSELSQRGRLRRRPGAVIGIEPDTGLITTCELTAGNVGDAVRDSDRRGLRRACRSVSNSSTTQNGCPSGWRASASPH